MKKAIIIALIAVFTSTPVWAGGVYREIPSSSGDSCPLHECNVVKGIGWILKLPFRLVAATGVGLYDLITDQTLEGFEDGYNAI